MFPDLAYYSFLCMPEAGKRILERRRVISFFKPAIQRRGLIFIHIPKSAGTSLSRHLYEGVEVGHHRAVDVQRWLPEEFDRYPSLSVVRNPYARLVSAYYYLKAGGNNDVDAAFARRVLSKYPTLSRFVESGLKDSIVLRWIHFVPQYRFLCNHNQLVVVDTVVKLEDLQCSKELARLGIDVSNLQRSNQGPLKDDVLSSREKEIVYEVYQEDFKVFGFER